MKKETYSQKEKRVVRELNTRLKAGKKITKLTEDQRSILLIQWAETKHKNFNFPKEVNYSPWDENISSDAFRKGFESTLTKAIKYAKDNRLIDASYGFDEVYYNSIIVLGFIPMSDQNMIDRFTNEYKTYEIIKKEKQEKKKKSIKTIVIGNKKYKLTELK